MSKRMLTIALAALALAPAALAQSAGAPAQPEKPAAAKPAAPAITLKVGDKAPPMSVNTWVQGEPISGFEKGKVYVVEFWATWCGPCRVSIPHLSELQTQYKDKGVTIIGVTSADPNNTLDGVKAMVKDFGERMNYHVAWDEGRTTNAAYMRASGQRGIPTAFVVDRDTNLAWIGHPMNMDAVLGHVVAGTWNDATRAELKAAEEAEQKAMGELAMAMQTGDAAKLETLLPGAITRFEKDSGTLNQIAWTIVDPEGPMAGKTTPKLLDIALDAATKADAATKGKDAAIIDTLARAHWAKGDKAKAIELQTKAVGLADAALKADLQKVLDEYKGK